MSNIIDITQKIKEHRTSSSFKEKLSALITASSSTEIIISYLIAVIDNHENCGYSIVEISEDRVTLLKNSADNSTDILIILTINSEDNEIIINFEFTETAPRYVSFSFKESTHKELYNYFYNKLYNFINISHTKYIDLISKTLSTLLLAFLENK